MTAVILQARLDSSRLPGKALLDLGGKPVILRVMENLKNVPVDEYVLACDRDSFQQLSPLAGEAGFKCIPGPKEDVLGRFALVINTIKADIIVRATGDNPFLFSDAAAESLARFKELGREGTVDYFTYTGLPHGSGVEILSASAVLKASGKSFSAYEREHVGPALYLHKNEYNCIFEKAPEKWFYPDLRTTIDTSADYSRASRVAGFLAEENQPFPVFSSDIIRLFDFVLRPVIFIPAANKNSGTGHLRRTFSAVLKLSRFWNCFILIRDYGQKKTVDEKVLSVLFSYPEDDRRFLEKKIRADFLSENDPVVIYRIVLDNFNTKKDEMLRFLKTAPVIAVDEGGEGRAMADYVFDVIPSLRNAPGVKKFPGNSRKAIFEANRFSPSCVPLPPLSQDNKQSSNEKVKTVLVVAGGADEAGISLPYGKWFASCGFTTTVVSAVDFANQCLKTIRNIPCLSQKLKEYDLVATHFGFTAFEALASGCRVVLFAPSGYHKKLAVAYGFPLLPDLKLSGKPEILRRFVESLSPVPPVRGACAGYINKNRASEDYASALSILLTGKSYDCACCGHKFSGKETDLQRNKPSGFRFPEKTVMFCPRCGNPCIRYSLHPKKSYQREYFFSEYEKQYGKTYLEDFESIRCTGIRRMREISMAVGKSMRYISSNGEKKILDVGCAFGPFLSAANDMGWKPFGTDISSEAVKYVKENLHFPAVVSNFPAIDFSGTDFPSSFHSVTFWYVIEHFENIPEVFKKVNEILLPGGILAISTPSCTGISARKNKRDFFLASPQDHFSIWCPKTAKKLLKGFGFRVVKIVITGHHPERFPSRFVPGFLKGFYTLICGFVSRVFKLGDTFEIYAEKMKTEKTK